VQQIFTMMAERSSSVNEEEQKVVVSRPGARDREKNR
jgi:hypothetical protein